MSCSILHYYVHLSLSLSTVYRYILSHHLLSFLFLYLYTILYFFFKYIISFMFGVLVVGCCGWGGGVGGGGGGGGGGVHCTFDVYQSARTESDAIHYN